MEIFDAFGNNYVGKYAKVLAEAALRADPLIKS